MSEVTAMALTREDMDVSLNSDSQRPDRSRSRTGP
jgi:hypothetical protein